MASGEGSDADAKEEQGGGDDGTAARAETDQTDGDGAKNGGGSLAAQPEDRLREAWPQIELDGDKGLVVCTVDVQLLTDTVQVLHSQINLLRQTVLDMRQAEAQEIAELRGQVDSLEKSGQGSAGARLDEMDLRLRAMERQPRGSGLDAGQNERLELLEGAVWGASNVAAEETGAVEENGDEPIESDPQNSGDEGGDEGEGEEEEAAVDAAVDASDGPRKPPKMKTLAKTVLMFGGLALCPKVDTLQSQLGSIDGRERMIEERVAALESQLAAEAEGAEAAAAERRRKSLRRLLRQAAALRRTVIDDGLVGAGTDGSEAAEEGACWAGSGEDGSEDGERRRGSEDEQATEEEFVEKAQARLAWLENHVAQTPISGVSAATAAASTGEATGEDSERQESDDTVPRDTIDDDGVPAEDALTSGEDGGGQLQAAGTSPPLAWASPGEEEGDEVGGGGAWADGEGGGDGEVERLWCRMDKVENCIYQRRAGARRLKTPPSFEAPAAEVLSAGLKDLRDSLESSSLTLRQDVEEGLGSLGGRIEALEDNVRMVKARALSRSALDAVAVAAPPDDSRIEQILASLLGDELPTVHRSLESVTDRVTSLEAAMADSAGLPGLAEEAATAAADAARQANEETQARMAAELSALEERMDRRAREEARRAREEREASEARESMRRVSATVSAYTADLATRLEGLRSEHEQQGAVVTRTAEEIAAAEATLRDLGSELVGLGQVANSVSTVVDGKANQTDVDALKAAMQRLDATMAAKARGSSAAAARDAEAMGALQAAFKDMSTSMEGSMRKLQQAQAAAGSIKIKPLLDKVVKELTAAGMLPDPDAGKGAAGRAMCLSCNRPIGMSGEQPTSRFAEQFRGGTLGNRMEKMSAASSPLQINKPAVIWRGGFKMPPRRIPATSHGRQQQNQQQQQQQRAQTAGTLGGGRVIGMGASPSQNLPPSNSVMGGLDSRLPGIPNILDSDKSGASSARGGKVSVGSLTLSVDAPHRGRFVRQQW